MLRLLFNFVLGFAITTGTVLGLSQFSDAVVIKPLNETTVAVETVNKSDNETATKHILTAWFFDPANLKKLLNLPAAEKDEISDLRKRHTYAESINKIQRQRKNKSLDPLITLHMGDFGSPRKRKQTGEDFYEESLQPETFISPEDENPISVLTQLKDKAYKSIVERIGNITVKPATVLTVQQNDKFDGLNVLDTTISVPSGINANQTIRPITGTATVTTTVADVIGTSPENGIQTETNKVITSMTEDGTEATTSQISSGVTKLEVKETFAEDTIKNGYPTTEALFSTTKSIPEHFTTATVSTTQAEINKNFNPFFGAGSIFGEVSRSTTKLSTFPTIEVSESTVRQIFEPTEQLSEGGPHSKDVTGLLSEENGYNGYQTIKYFDHKSEKTFVEDLDQSDTTTRASVLDMVLSSVASTTKEPIVNVASVKVIPIVQREYTVLLIGIVLTCFGTVLVVGGLVFFFYYQKKKSSPNAVEMRSSKLYDDV